MLHGTDIDNMQAELVRSTLLAIHKTQPALANALANKLGKSVMNGLSGILDDFASAMKTISGTAADIYKTKLDAQIATDQASAVAQAEAQKMQVALQQQQLAAQTTYAQQQLAQQQLALQQYQAQLKSGTTNTALMVGGLGILAVLAISFMGRKKRR